MDQEFFLLLSAVDKFNNDRVRCLTSRKALDLTGLNFELGALHRGQLGGQVFIAISIERETTLLSWAAFSAI
jgi:hypothetical protein